MYSVTKNKEQEYFLAMYACIYPSPAKPRPVPCFFNPLVTLSTPVLLSSLCLQRHLLPGQHRQHLHVHGAPHPRRRGAVPAVEVPHVRGLEERVVPGLQSPHRSMCCVPPHYLLDSHVLNIYKNVGTRLEVRPFSRRCGRSDRYLVCASMLFVGEARTYMTLAAL